jgi:two-component system, sensor histidine kinase and response regulator
MIESSPTLLERTLSREIMPKLVSFYQELANLSGKDALWLTERDLQPLAGVEEEWLCLLLSDNYCGLLWGKLDYSNPRLVHTIIIFQPRSIEPYLNSISSRLQPRSKLGKKLQKTDWQNLGKVENFPSNSLLKLLDIWLEKLPPESNDSQKKSHPVRDVLKNRLQQEKILDRIKIQIGQNLDLLEIIKVTIEQVLNLLQLDRLLIYQLNVEINDGNQEKKLVDAITYESVFQAPEIDEPIQSILHFQDEVCFSQSQQCREKYQQGFSLAVDNIEECSNLAPCLQKMLQKMQVKAKVVTPIIVRGKLWGFLIAHQCLAPRKWRSNDIDFLRQISEYLAIAIYQAESYQQLQEQKQLLERQVKQRAKQLQDALLAAKSATQLKNEFLGNMSHELRTPLTCIIGLSGTLLHWSQARGERSIALEKQQQYLRTIQESGRHLLDLVNDILEFSEVEAGKTLLNINQLSLRNLARSTIQNFQAAAELKQINLELDLRIDSKFDRFLADSERLEQILANLIGNAIKFTAAGGTVTLRMWRDLKQTVFEIEDTGIGIAPQNLLLLFEKFQQLEKSRERTYGGAGLSLALTKHLIELHGGRIEVESKIGKGSLFTVYLPNEVIGHDKQSKPIESKKTAITKGKTIILVTKDEEMATLICELLTVANYQVVWLITAKISIEQIETLEPSVLILDQDCPDLDLKKFCHNFKQLHTTKQIKIIALMPQLTTKDCQDLHLNGVDEYSPKPIQLTHLLTKIDLLIQE